MAKVTGISWCDSTANLWIGCSKVSGACDNCYAEDMMGGLGEEPVGGEGRRFRRVRWGPKGDRSYCKQGWSDLRRWQRAAERNGGIDPELGRKRVVFINSLSDFFDNHRSVIWRAAAWELFRECTHLILILVTKRPQLIERELPEFWDEIADRFAILTTAEDQEWLDRRVPEMFDAFRGRKYPRLFGISGEPLFGELDLRAYLSESYECGLSCGTRLPFRPTLERCHTCGEDWGPDDPPVVSEGCPSCGGELDPICPDCDHYMVYQHPDTPYLGFVIIGGESGRGARPMPSLDAVRTILRHCREGDAAFHLKQLSQADHPKDFDDFESFPADLQIRENPLMEVA